MYMTNRRFPFNIIRYAFGHFRQVPAFKKIARNIFIILRLKKLMQNTNTLKLAKGFYFCEIFKTYYISLIAKYF